MKDNVNKIPDLDDLLFELRNKDYGAYQLRKRYNSVVIVGIIISSLLFSSAVIIPFILSTAKSDRIISGGMYTVRVQMDNLDSPIDQIIVPPAPPPPEPARIQKVAAYIPPVVVDSMPLLEPLQASIDELLAQSSVDDFEVRGGTGGGGDMMFGQDGTVTDDPFVFVEVMPSFRGGDISKFREWVGSRTNYPQLAIDNKIKGTVYLTFVVERDGSVSNVTVLKGVDPLLDNEAVRAISESPRWTPGLQRGQPVRVRFQIPLNFMF